MSRTPTRPSLVPYPSIAGRLAGLAVAGLALAVVRRSSWRWGATPTEYTLPLPGDDLLATSDLTSTRAITIDASAAEVWPWIAQLGQGRGGFYSYDRLENLVGCDIHSADRVVAAWQDVEVGDAIRLHPDVALSVAVVEAEDALVLRGGVAMGGVQPPYDFTWAFVLRPGPSGATRLLVRERYEYSRWWSAALVEPVELVSLVMSRRMLRGIKQRAEARRR